MSERTYRNGFIVEDFGGGKMESKPLPILNLEKQVCPGCLCFTCANKKECAYSYHDSGNLEETAECMGAECNRAPDYGGITYCTHYEHE